MSDYLPSLLLSRHTTRSSDDASMHTPLKRAWVEIDLGALMRNGAAMAARGAALIPMVKGDAYGLGAVPVARAPRQPWRRRHPTPGDRLHPRARRRTRRHTLRAPGWG